MTYHIRSQADWQACMEVLERGDIVYIHAGFYMTRSEYASIHDVSFIGVGGNQTITITDEPPPPPQPRQYYLVSPVFAGES